MYTPTSTDFDALVALSRGAGLDPLDVALVLYHESGFDPGNVGPSAAADVAGLNQMSGDNLKDVGLSRSDWLGMTAAMQLPHVFAFWRGLAQTFNKGRMPRDAGELLGLNFLPGAWKAVDAGDDADAVLAGADGPFAWAYNDNPALQNASGSIRVNTLRAYLASLRRHLTTSARWSMIVNGIAAAIARAEQGGPGGGSAGASGGPLGGPVARTVPRSSSRITAAGLPLVGWLALGVVSFVALARRAPGRA
jgi:hypothetical protein